MEFSKLTRSERIKILGTVGYSVVRYPGISPFEYRAPKGEPESFHQTKNIRYWILFTYILSIQFGALILYWYYQAFFGQVTKLEYYMVIGLNAMFVMMNACQWYLISSFHRGGGLNVVNISLETWFCSSAEPPFVYELLVFIVSFGMILFPWMYFSMLIISTQYFPGIFRILYFTADSLALFTGIQATIFQYVIAGLWSVAIGHSCISTGIVCHWITIFYFATNQYFDLILKSPSQNQYKLDSKVMGVDKFKLRLKFLYLQHHSSKRITFKEALEAFFVPENEMPF